MFSLKNDKWSRRERENAKFRVIWHDASRLLFWLPPTVYWVEIKFWLRTKTSDPDYSAEKRNTIEFLRNKYIN